MTRPAKYTPSSRGAAVTMVVWLFLFNILYKNTIFTRKSQQKTSVIDLI